MLFRSVSQSRYGKANETLVKHAVDDGPGVTLVIEQEPGSAGKLLVSAVELQPQLKGFKVVGSPVSSNKVVRAQPLLAAIEAGNVHLVRSSWNETWADEYDGFPAGEHDDQVDSAAHAYGFLTGYKTLRVSWGREDSNTHGNGAAGNGSNPGSTYNASKSSIILPNGTEYPFDPTVGVAGVRTQKVGIVWGR